jgi:hypothetical protein
MLQRFNTIAAIDESPISNFPIPPKRYNFTALQARADGEPSGVF